MNTGCGLCGRVVIDESIILTPEPNVKIVCLDCNRKVWERALAKPEPTEYITAGSPGEFSEKMAARIADRANAQMERWQRTDKRNTWRSYAQIALKEILRARLLTPIPVSKDITAESESQKAANFAAIYADAMVAQESNRFSEKKEGT